MVKILIFCLFVLFSNYLLSQSVTWTQFLPPTEPSNRDGLRIEKISDNEILLFGGYNGGYQNDTWIFNNTSGSWTQIFPATSPSSRSSHSLVNINSNEVLLFGGFNGGQLGDTWIFNKTTQNWSQIVPPTAPSARNDFGYAKINDNEVVLFGGYDGASDNETWIFNITSKSWTQVFPATPPSARYATNMSSVSENKAILFAGFNAGIQGGTYIFDGDTDEWSLITPPNSPSSRYSYALQQVGENEVLLFGGDDGPNNYLNDTWIFNNTSGSWTQIVPASSPSARRGHFLASISDYELLLFGGYNTGVFQGETWISSIITNPTISNSVSVSAGVNSVNINALLYDGNSNVTYFVEYGLSSGNYSNTFSGVLNNSGVETNTSIPISSLNQQSTYYFRINIVGPLGTVTSSEYSFTTLAANADDNDTDGVDNTIESSAPNSGDGNNDGLQDSQQANVASLRGISGSYITVQLVSCDSLLNVENFLRTENDNFEFPFGVISFSAPCSEAQVKIYYHNVNDLSLYSYRKETASGRWIEYEDSEFSIETIDGEQVAVATLTLSDGGIGDSDGIVNGIIVDPGGPAIPITANIPIWEWWWVLVIIPIIIYTYRRLT